MGEQSWDWCLVKNIMRLVIYLGLIAIVIYTVNAQNILEQSMQDESEDTVKRGIWDNRIRLAKKRSPWDNRIRLAKKGWDSRVRLAKKWDNRIRLAKKWDNRIRLAKKYMDWDKRIRLAKKSNWDNRIRLVKKELLDYNDPLLVDYQQEENYPSSLQEDQQ